MAEHSYTLAYYPAPVDRAEDEPVPVYSPDRHLLGFWPAWKAERNGNLRLVRSRKGHVKRAYLRSDDPEIVELLITEGRRSNYGCGFTQHLESGGVVWALRGVRGSY